MRKVLLPVAGFLAAALSGCVPSLNPLYTAKDIKFDQELIGAWAEEDSPDDTWTFSKMNDESYRLEIRDGKKTAPFIAHLVQLGNRKFLDLTPDEEALNDVPLLDIYKMMLIPGHLFMKVTKTEPTLNIGMLDPDWVEELLKANPKAIEHQYQDGRVILTAPTPSLQAFMLKHFDTKDAYGEEGILKRKK